MAIQSGNHIGPYEIVSAIGAGGMGEVYRARDSKLGSRPWQWGVTADGTRFLLPVPTGQAAPTQINVVLNWTEELKRLVPTGKK